MSEENGGRLLSRATQGILTAGLTAVLVASCGGGTGSPATPNAAAGLSKPTARESERGGTKAPSIVYLSEFSTTSAVIIVGYTVGQLHRVVCSIPFNNIGVLSGGVDKNGTLWLPTQSSPPAVYSYGSDCGPRGITLRAPKNASPDGIAFGDYGTNYVIMRGDHYDKIYAYPKGKTKWTRTLFPPSRTCCSGIGVDKLGNVYGSLPANPGVIVEFKHGRGKAINLNVQALGYPGNSIMFDRHNNMIVPDKTNSVVDVFSPPYSGLPRQITLVHPPYECALNRRETLLGCGAEGSGYRETDFYSYPQGKYEFDIPSIPAYFVSFDPSANN